MRNSGFYVGGLLIFCGAFCFLRYRTRRDEIVGVTWKQFVWICAIAVLCGLLTAVMQFFE
jgi:hypothetical protein